MKADRVRFGFDGEGIPIGRNSMNFQWDAEHHPNCPAAFFGAKMKNGHDSFPSVHLRCGAGWKALARATPACRVILQERFAGNNGMSVPLAGPKAVSTEVPIGCKVTHPPSPFCVRM